MIAALAHAYAKAGNAKEAMKKLDELNVISSQRYVSAYPIALVQLALGRKEKAFEWLEKAHRERDEMMTHLRVDPRLDGLREDPRFRALLRRTGVE